MRVHLLETPCSGPTYAVWGSDR